MERLAGEAKIQADGELLETLGFRLAMSCFVVCGWRGGPCAEDCGAVWHHGPKEMVFRRNLRVGFMTR